MDLIYTNADREDVGVLFNYELDLAFGDSENNFECTIQANSHCMEAGSFLYVEGTEYGGIVDGIKVDTEKESITYTGRTWHGILAGNIIEPDEGYDHLIVSGDAHSVLAGLVERLGLSMIFRVSDTLSGIEIVNYAFGRYTDAYTGIKKMLAKVNGKLKMEYHNRMVVLSAVYRSNYSRYEDWDTSQVAFTIKKNYRATNHLICLGGGNLKDRFVIHLFTDKNGAIQPYRTVENPVSDDDYILDKSGQRLFGIDEVAEVLDFPSAQTRENFVKLSEQPSDWATNYSKYFTLDENNVYIAVEGVLESQATLLVEEPLDWETRFANYFIKKNERFASVEAVTVEEYKVQTTKPSDWEDNYGNYFVYSSDGVTGEWKKVSPATATRYNMQTEQPSDWNTNWKSYYVLILAEDIPPQHRDPDYPYGFRRLGDVFASSSATPGFILDWRKEYFYTLENYITAPEWEKDTYHTLIEHTTAPTWKENTYYTVSNVIVRPPFTPNSFFEKRLDHFAELVESGVERLEKSYNCDSVSIDLGLEDEYDIGDIVGATERITGISVWQPIAKKIVSIKNNVKSVNYEIGVI